MLKLHLEKAWKIAWIWLRRNRRRRNLKYSYKRPVRDFILKACICMAEAWWFGCSSPSWPSDGSHVPPKLLFLSVFLFHCTIFQWQCSVFPTWKNKQRWLLNYANCTSKEPLSSAFPLFQPPRWLFSSLSLNKKVSLKVSFLYTLSLFSLSALLIAFDHQTAEQSHVSIWPPQTDRDCQLILARWAAAVISLSCPTEICRHMLGSRCGTHLFQHISKQPNWPLLSGTRQAALCRCSKMAQENELLQWILWGEQCFPFPTWFRAISTLLS